MDTVSEPCLCHCHATGYCDECGGLTGEEAVAPSEIETYSGPDLEWWESPSLAPFSFLRDYEPPAA